MREVATVQTTASGNDIPMPTENDTSNKGAILAENAQITEQDITFGSTTLNAYMYTSKLVRVSMQLMQDSAFDMNSFLGVKLGERIARIHNEHFTTGTGSSQPQGVATAAVTGVTAASATAITYAEIVDLEHSLDPAYRNNARFMMKDSTLQILKKLVDGDSRPLWTAGVASGEQDRLLGYPYVINQDMPAATTGLDSLLFGDFSKYMIRDVAGAGLMRLTERYADYLQVGFFAFMRSDGKLLDAGTNPIKTLQMAAA